MSQYQPSAPPPAPEALSPYVARELRAVADALQILESNMLALSVHTDVAHLPERLSGGELARLNNALVAGDVAGYSPWERLSAKSIGQMQLDAASLAFPDLGAGWQTLNVFDALPFPARGMVMVTATGRFVLVNPGVYLIAMVLAFDHNELNAGRSTQVRFYNVTKGVGDTGLTIPTGRNTDASASSATLLVAVPSTEIGDAFELQIGAGSAYSLVSFTTASLAVVGISEYAI